MSQPRGRCRPDLGWRSRRRQARRWQSFSQFSASKSSWLPLASSARPTRTVARSIDGERAVSSSASSCSSRVSASGTCRCAAASRSRRHAAARWSSPACAYSCGSVAEVGLGVDIAIVGLTGSGQAVKCRCSPKPEHPASGLRERSAAADGFIAAGGGGQGDNVVSRRLARDTRRGTRSPSACRSARTPRRTQHPARRGGRSWP